MKWEINEPRTHETSWIMTCHDTSQLNMISCNWLAETSRVTKDSSRFLLASVSWNKRCIWKLELDPIWTGNCVQRLKCECNESWPVLAPNTAHNLRAFSALNKLLTNVIFQNYTIQNIQQFHNFQNSKIQAHSFSRSKASMCCNSGCA